jgi:glycosyltransferase involved in cell wall biosynthesis
VVNRAEVAVLMPTYNDSKYVAGAIKSLLSQNFEDWELIIIDGSTDSTPEIVKQFTDSDARIKYLREKRSGQLNALMYGAQFVQCRYVTILHSDDEFSDGKALERNVSSLRESDCDGVFCDLSTINADGEVYGRTRAVNRLGASSPAILFLRGGSNIIPDFFFVKKEVFSNVFSNYILWNMPYWLKFAETRIDILKLLKVQTWYKYRVYSDNYIRSAVGKFEAINGRLRTIIQVGQRLDFPFLRVQRLMVRFLKERMKPLVKFSPCSPGHLREIVKSVLESYFERTPENLYFTGLQGFYASFPSTRVINLRIEQEDEILLGKDARIFFDLMEKRKLPAIYKYVLEEAAKGFGTVVVKGQENYEKTKNMMRFLNLLAKIEKE